MNTKEYSFWELISEYQRIVIPAIQRDYAQGRKSESRIAISLVNNLFESLTSTETKKMNLYFVYGKIEDQDFIPLDGQQRLTTLFLLHWFLSIGFLSEKDKNNLSKFTYQTRPSSEDFCLKLAKESIVYDGDMEVSEQIVNSRWFFLSWKNDPTISAMLNMLDIIQDIFKQPDEILFNKLIGEDSPVKFHFLPLKKFKLDDKIYVKMNSRGKPLTEYENFKSNFSNLFDITRKSKLDNEWLDIFWKFEKDKKQISIKKVDRRYLNFLKNVTFSFFAERDDIDITFKEKYNIFDDFGKIYSSNSETLDKLSRILDSLVSFKDNEKYFGNILKDEPDYHERLRFYAIMQFFIHWGNLNGANKKLYDKWMRVCTNLINNTNINKPELFCKAIRSIKELSGKIGKLYKYISKKETKIEGFLQKQCKEEKVKAALILKNNNWKKEIYDIEKNRYFAGQIGFILMLSKKEEEFNLELFREYSAKLNILFGDLFREKKDCLFQRALLTFNEYLVPIYNGETFCTFDMTIREKNDNWRKVFGDREKRQSLKDLLDSIHIESIERDLEDIVEKYPNNDWKKLFIKNKGIIEHCGKYRIAKWENKIVLSRSYADYWSRHADLYSYVLFLELKNENNDVSYFDSAYDVPWIKLNWKGKYYRIKEVDNGYSFDFYENNKDSEGLKEMKEYVENVIAGKKLEKPAKL